MSSLIKGVSCLNDLFLLTAHPLKTKARIKNEIKFFIYLKLNPEVSSNELSDNNILETETITEQEIIDNTIKKLQQSMVIEENSIEVSKILFTGSELKRAKSYQKRDWKADDTINMEAWEYALKNPNINSIEKIQIVNISN